MWEGKPDKIKRDIIFKDYSEGGLRMINLEKFITSLKITWVRKMILSNKKYLQIENYINDLNLTFKLGPEYINKHIKNVTNPFWKDVYLSYYTFCTSLVPVNLTELKSQHLFYNNNIKAGGKFIYRPKLVEKGIYTINDILKQDGSVLTFDNIVEIHGHIINFLDYASLISAVNQYINETNIHTETIGKRLMEPMLPFPISILLRNQNGCRQMYDKLIKNNVKPSSLKKRLEEFNNDDYLTNILQHFKIPFTCCSDTHLQWFQTRINHRILGTNFLLKKMNIKDNDLCSFCRNEQETILHLFYECPIVNVFVKNLEILINTHCPNTPLNLRAKDIIFGNRFYSKILNTILILAKYYIFKTRETNHLPNINIFKSNIRNRYKMDQQIAKSNMNGSMNDELWKPLISLIIH